MVENGRPPIRDMRSLFEVRRHIYTQLNNATTPANQMTNSDCLDHIRDLAKQFKLSFRTIRDATGQHLSVYVFDEHAAYGVVEQFDPKADMSNPQWLGSVRRLGGAEGVKGTTRW